jgi:hypothetical protein
MEGGQISESLPPMTSSRNRKSIHHLQRRPSQLVSGVLFLHRTARILPLRFSYTSSAENGEQITLLHSVRTFCRGSVVGAKEGVG